MKKYTLDTQLNVPALNLASTVFRNLENDTLRLLTVTNFTSGKRTRVAYIAYSTVSPNMYYELTKESFDTYVRRRNATPYAVTEDFWLDVICKQTVIEPGDFIKASDTRCCGFVARSGTFGKGSAAFKGYEIVNGSGTDVIPEDGAVLVQKSDDWWNKAAQIAEFA